MLRFWLPFTKDGRNIGLSPTSSTTFSTMIVSEKETPRGGKCGTGMVVYHMTEDEFDNQYTVALWAKSNEASWPTSNCLISCKNKNNDTSACHWYFSIYGGNNLAIGVNGSAAAKKHSYAFSLGTWYHLAVTYDGAKYCLYVNGGLIGSGTVTTAKSEGCTNIGIGCRSKNAGGTDATGTDTWDLQDVRIYDHALKDWEIKKLASKQMFEIESNLHLDGSENLIGYVNSSNVGWGSYGFGGRGVVSIEENENGPFYGTVIRVRGNNSASTTTFAAEAAKSHTMPKSLNSGDTLTFSCYVKGIGSSIGRDVHSHIYINSSDGNISTGTYSKFGEDWKRVSHTLKWTKSVSSYTSPNTYIVGYIKHNEEFLASNFQLEYGPTAKPYKFNTVEERFTDSSGLDNEIVPYNIVQSGSSLYFNGENSAIKVPLHKMISGGTWTINLWFYRKSGEFSSKGYESFFGGPSGFELDSKNGTGTTPCVYIISAFGSGNKPYECDKWNMVTMTRTPDETKFYLNGEWFKTGSAGTTPSGNYFIGAWVDQTKQNFKGYMKRFSVYQKALTDEEIKNLYLNNE